MHLLRASRYEEEREIYIYIEGEREEFLSAFHLK